MSGRWITAMRGMAALICLSGTAACDRVDRSATVVQVGAANSDDWPSHGGGDDESSYSRLDEINAKSVNRLKLAWSLDLPDEASLEATPLSIDGTLYFTGSLSTVYAADGATGRLLWKFDPAVSRHMPDKMRLIFAVNRGVAYSNGKIFVGTIDGRLIALDARTGRSLWSVSTTPANGKYTITGAPRVFRDKVIIGNGGADWGARGYVTAYDTASGRQAWRFYTVPGSPRENAADPVMQMAARTWGGEYWKTGTGGTVWNGITFDPELGRVYIGTGNSGPYNPAVRSPGNGDNLFLASIVALDADTGKYIWHYQVNPREAWDFKATMNMIATTIPIDGRPRKVLLQAPTNGFFYVLDRVSGKLISAEKLGKVTWAERIDLKGGRPVEAPDIRYQKGPVTIWPSPFGMHNWQSMSYSPRTGLVYIPTMQVGARYEAVKSGAMLGGTIISPVIADKNDGKGALLAWDPVTQKLRWKAPLATLWNGGTLATAGDLVFQGTGDGVFTAYDGRTGTSMWSFNAGLGIISDPMTYRVRGRQYIGLLVGYGGSTAMWSGLTNQGWKYGAQPRRLLAFALDGKASLPPTPPRDLAVHAVVDPAFKPDAAIVAQGMNLFNSNCAMCHGLNARSAGAPAPDLRESGVPLDRDTFRSVVKDGLLQERGMPRFESFSDADIERLRHFVRSRALAASRGESGGANEKAGKF